MQSKKHCNFLVHYQLLWQKCNLLVDNWLPYKLARYVYSSNSIAPQYQLSSRSAPLSVTKPPCTQCWHMMIFELLSQETNMNMWQEGSILPVRINQPNLVSPSPPFPTPGALWQSSNPNKLGRRPDGLRHMSHPCWRQRVYFQVGDVLSAQQLLNHRWMKAIITICHPGSRRWTRAPKVTGTIQSRPSHPTQWSPRSDTVRSHPLPVLCFLQWLLLHRLYQSNMLDLKKNINYDGTKKEIKTFDFFFHSESVHPPAWNVWYWVEERPHLQVL